MSDSKSHVLLFVVVSGTPTKSEDLCVRGRYSVLVETALSAGDRATAALDCFHEHVAIGELEDFDIRVYDVDGNEMPEGDKPSYTLGKYAQMV